MVKCFLGDVSFRIQLLFQFFDQKKTKNKQIGLHAEKPLSGDSLIDSTIGVRSYIPYIIMMHTVCHYIIIVCIILRYDRLDYGLIMMRTLIAMR